MAEDQSVAKVQEGAQADVHNTSTGSMSNGVTKVNREFQEKSTLKKAKELGLPYVNIGKTPLNPDFLKLLDYEAARKAKAIPFFRVGKKLRLAVFEPQNEDTRKAIKTLQDKGYEVNLSLCSSAGIADALLVYQREKKYREIKLVETVSEKAIGTYEKEIAGLSDLPEKLKSVTAEEGLNLINVGAMKTKASDVHYEPSESTVVIRMRIDGVLHKAFEIDHEIYERLSSQLKYASKLRLNVATVPQDGRFSFAFNEKKVAVRVSSIPTPYGESFVCRYLVSEAKPLSLEDLGFGGLGLKKLQNACKIPHGMILATGPTGSGKTTTLYAILDVMKTSENKIITLEDPVEYNIEGVTQSQINEEKGYNFASGLRTMLRQDPDIVMLGEIRDLETAETAAQASLTGHVLLSTLHTNSAIESIPRLVNMGLPPFMVAPALNTVIAQRLVRRVCKNCSNLAPITDSEREEFASIMKTLEKVNPSAVIDIPNKVPKTAGCEGCSNTGYMGRMVVAEVITVNEQLKELILNNASLVDMIAAARKEGIITMREDGFLKVAQGLTTMEEVYRVTNVLGSTT